MFGNWVSTNLLVVIGDEKISLFESDTWVDGGVSNERFNRFLVLCAINNCY